MATDSAFLSRQELWADHDRRIARQQSVEARAVELRLSAEYIHMIDALDAAMKPLREGQEFEKELLELVRTGKDHAQLGRLICKAVDKYFIGVADMEVE